MRRWLAIAVCAVLVASWPAATTDAQDALLDFSETEIRQILRHGPWPMAWSRDPSNRVSGTPAAIRLGKRLFFERRLSLDGSASCATCHNPKLGWSDGGFRGAALAEVDRNSMSLINVRHNRWFGWDGAGDSLWAQSIVPFLDARELGSGPAHVKKALAGDRVLARAYAQVFGTSAARRTQDDVLVDVTKALAAYLETNVSGRTPFDDFRDALARGDRAAAVRYPLAAQRGLRVFVGKGRCTTCHTGPNFTNGEFADTGVPYFVRGTKVDPGRHGGIEKLQASPYNLLGRFNDDPARATGWATRQVVLGPRNWGEFKVPSLRNLARTGPYMHNGLLVSLEIVVLHYSELDLNRFDYHGGRVLRRLDLSKPEVADLVAFLESLSETPPR